jgi:hypothetical protein
MDDNKSRFPFDDGKPGDYWRGYASQGDLEFAYGGGDHTTPSGGWAANPPEKSYRMAGRTLGLVGFGNIGQSVAELQTTVAEEAVRVCTGGLPLSIANPEVLHRLGRFAEWTPSYAARWQMKRLERLRASQPADAGLSSK